jgi:glycosyltransferase involved in cell wall biosynthesis
LSDFQERKYGIRSKEAKAAHKLEKRVFESANATVVTTPRMAADAISRYGLSTDNVKVIPNYVETDRFIPVEREANTLLHVAFVGRLDKQKNLRTLLRAISDFEVEVWLIGYGPQREELESLTKNAKAKFKFLGNVPNRELPMLLSQCDIFVLPSLYEGHPKALLEAMACGLPAVGTNVAGIQDVIRNEETGLLCGLDVDELRNALGRLIGDEALRQRLGSAGRAFVVEQFALERVVDLELDLLKQLTA